MSKENFKRILADPQEFEKIASKGFHELDTNKSGFIDIHEIENLLKIIAKQNGLPEPSKADVENSFKQLDHDKSGKIDFNEFKSFFKIYMESML